MKSEVISDWEYSGRADVIAEWWLSKFKQELDSIKDEIEKRHWKPLKGEDIRAQGYNAALSEFLSILSTHIEKLDK